MHTTSNIASVAGTNSPSAPWLVCRSGGKLYALPLTAVVEMMRPLPIQAVPHASPAVLGVALIRGMPMAVLDMPGLLGGTWKADGRFVTVRAGSRQVALAVDQVLEVRTLPTETFRELPPLLRDIGNDGVAAIGTLDAELLFVLKDACLIPDHLSTVSEQLTSTL